MLSTSSAAKMAAHERQADEFDRSTSDLSTFSLPALNFSTLDISIPTAASSTVDIPSFNFPAFDLSTLDWSSHGMKSKISLASSGRPIFHAPRPETSSTAENVEVRGDDQNEKQEGAPAQPPTTQSSNELTGWKLGILVASLCSAVFCVALDNTS